jgi:hypothetical protein
VDLAENLEAGMAMKGYRCGPLSRPEDAVPALR